MSISEKVSNGATFQFFLAPTIVNSECEVLYMTI